MNVTEAIISRRSIRAFLSKPVKKEKLEAILKMAARAPSWANSQPWNVFVATGDTLEPYQEGLSGKVRCRRFRRAGGSPAGRVAGIG